jgi:hypothetical protein
LVGLNHPIGGCHIGKRGAILYLVSLNPKSVGGKELKKFMLMAALVAVVVAALALPALAQGHPWNNKSSWEDNASRFNDSNNRPWDNWWNNNRFSDNNNQFNESNNRLSEDNNRFNDNNRPWDNNDRFNDNNNGGDNWWNNRPWDNNRFNDNNSGVSQTSEQQVQSGDSSQTFNVTGGGDNSNTCQGIQGISNTGNSVNSTNVLQYASEGGVGVSDSGNFTISPSSTTTCDQKVNQAATAHG